MNLVDIILVIVLLVVLFFAMKTIIKNRKSGGCPNCGGDCKCCKSAKKEK